MPSLERRALLTAAGATLATAGLPLIAQDSADSSSDQPSPKLGFCLNTSTIRGQKLPVPEQVRLAAEAGYDGIEPWIRELNAYRQEGGSLPDLRKMISDAGLTVESAIGFANWIVDDPEKRKEGLETAKRDMDLLREIGGLRIAAPPAGATRQKGLNLFQAAERYRDLLVLGEQTGVVPQAELWGFSASLSRLGELLFVASESGHPDACLLPDVYHIYKGGSSFEGLSLINGRQIHCFHMNDYPNIPREKIGDADRVYPGDGVAPLTKILRTIVQGGFRGSLSLELFNRTYWEQDAQQVVTTGLRKMREAVSRALS